MVIKKISISNDGFVYCKSRFYASRDVLNENQIYDFSVGINKLVGDIDSGNWAVSYLLAMHADKRKDFIVFNEPNIEVNGRETKLKDFLQYSCYMENSYPLFATKKSVEKLVSKGIEKNKLTTSPEEIRDFFHIDSQRFQRPLTGVGNEIFRAMAAIGHVHGKQVFCFPWLSQMMFDCYHGHMTDLLDILEKLEKVVILPIGKS